MSKNPEDFSPSFRIDVTPTTGRADPRPEPALNNTEALLRQLVIMQKRQNELLEQMVQHTVTSQQQRAHELQQWKNANPRLARACHRAAESLSKIQTQFLETLTEDVADNEETLAEGDFMLNEFVDRYGPRLAHLNGVLQVLAQLGTGVPLQQG